jgi:type II secretory pathway pseudopilin PulG
MTMDSFKKFKKNTSGQFRGFTLVEALTAVAVVTIGLVAILGLVAYAVSISRVSPDEVIAANLAQEGTEVIRSIRDTNLLAGADFDNGIIGGGPWAKIDFDTIAGFPHFTNADVGADILECAQTKGDTCRLFLDGDGFYSHDNTGEPTNFYRIVELERESDPDDGEYIRARSYVAWQDRKGNWRDIGVEDHFYEYDLEDVGSDVERFEWVASDTIYCVDWGSDLRRERDYTIGCQKPFKHNKKCGRFCLDTGFPCDFYDAANPQSGGFLYLASFDLRGFDADSLTPAFLGDPIMVCELFEWIHPSCTTNLACRIYEKKEVEY